MTTLKEKLAHPATIIVFGSILALFNSWPAFFFLKIGLFEPDSLWFTLTTSLGAFAIMFVLPWLLIKFVYKKNLSDFGLNLNNFGKIVKLSIIVILIFLPFIFLMANHKSFSDYYTVKQNLNIFFVFISLFSSVLYYFSEEFLFRGFIFFGTREKLRVHSYWIIALIFSILHLSKPGIEFIFAFAFSIAGCILSLKTKSFIPSAMAHFILALVLNILVTFHLTI